MKKFRQLLAILPRITEEQRLADEEIDKKRAALRSIGIEKIDGFDINKVLENFEPRRHQERRPLERWLSQGPQEECVPPGLISRDKHYITQLELSMTPPGPREGCSSRVLHPEKDCASTLSSSARFSRTEIESKSTNRDTLSSASSSETAFHIDSVDNAVKAAIHADTINKREILLDCDSAPVRDTNPKASELSKAGSWHAVDRLLDNSYIIQAPIRHSSPKAIFTGLIDINNFGNPLPRPTHGINLMSQRLETTGSSVGLESSIEKTSDYKQSKLEGQPGDASIAFETSDTLETSLRIDRLIKYAHALLVSYVSPNTCGAANESDAQTLTTATGTTSAKADNSSTQRGDKRKGSTPPRDDRDQDGNSRKHLKTSKAGTQKQNARRLACPYFQNNPILFRKSQACLGPGFITINHLQDHLYRVHNKHIDPLDGFDEEQEARLRDRKRFIGASTVKEKWVIVYRILFPEAISIPGPYYYHDLYSVSTEKTSTRVFSDDQTRDRFMDSVLLLIRSKLSGGALLEPTRTVDYWFCCLPDIARESMEEVEESFLGFHRCSNESPNGDANSNKLGSPSRSTSTGGSSSLSFQPNDSAANFADQPDSSSFLKYHSESAPGHDHSIIRDLDSIESLRAKLCPGTTRASPSDDVFDPQRVSLQIGTESIFDPFSNAQFREYQQSPFSTMPSGSSQQIKFTDWFSANQELGIDLNTVPSLTDSSSELHKKREMPNGAFDDLMYELDLLTSSAAGYATLLDLPLSDNDAPAVASIANEGISEPTPEYTGKGKGKAIVVDDGDDNWYKYKEIFNF